MRRFSYFIGLVVLLSSTTTYASLNKQWDKERALFQKTMTTKKSKRPAAIKKALPKLENYPLAQYLEYDLLTNSFTKKSAPRVIKFQRKYRGSRLSEQIQPAWLRYLNRQKQWERYLSEYARQPVNSTTFNCMKLQAEINTGRKKQAFNQVPSLWLSGKSQPKACDPVFNAWKKAGKLTSKLASDRFWLAVEKKNFSLAKYSAKFVKSKKLKTQINRFWKIKKQPQLLYKSTKLKDDIRTIAYGLEKLSRKEPKRVVTHWVKLRKSKKITNQQRLDINQRIAKRLPSDKKNKGKKLFAKLDPEYNQPQINEYRFREALKRADWDEIFKATQKLSAEQAKDDHWRYWQAIAIKKTQKDKDKIALASKSLLELSKNRSYYGYLAATLTQQPYQLAAERVELTDKEEKRIQSIPAIQRSIELKQLNRDGQAIAEWRHTLTKLGNKDKKLATMLASKLNWNFLAINSAAQSKAWHLVDARFPNPYPKLFFSFARKKNISKYWPVAIARQESAFKQNARSRVGARGLMQLMPRTAKQTARRHKIPYKRISQLTRPVVNIDLGTSYLSEMLKKFDGNHAYASAAYNAGPHRVSKWLSQRGKLPLDAWIETIPFKETRNYVKNVLTYKVIYQRLDKLKGEFLTPKEMAALSIPKLNATQLAKFEHVAGRES